MTAKDIVRRLRRPPRGTLQLAVQRLAQRLNIAELDVPLKLEHLADSVALAQARLHAEPHDARELSSPPRIGWVVIPAGAGSGGHTTLFRMVRAAAEAGFANTLLFYNRFDADMGHYAEVVRRAWPWLECEIAEVGARIEGFDACVASSWATAHVLAGRVASGTRNLYFIQDYEPYFYPRGETYAFAEDTYRFGFRNIALGPMIQRTLRREADADSDLVPFGADTTTFQLAPSETPRRGVVFYARPGNDRRGYRLAVMAMQEFHRQRPEQPIHAYGAADAVLPFPVINHGTVPPARLAELYNSVIAGLSLSFTNVSLVPEEMLACGAVPIVNDHDDVRAVLDNPYVVWAAATPTALAQALIVAVQREDSAGHARAVAASVAGRSWAPTEQGVVRILADELLLIVRDGHIAAR